MLPCQYKKYLGIECPGCGAQRSFLAMIKGEIIESFILFPALFPLIFTGIFLLLHLKFNFKHGARIIVISFATTASVMLINYVYKLSIL